MPEENTIKPTYEELEKQNQELKQYLANKTQEVSDLTLENIELKKFAEYVRSLRTQKDFLHLRNVILQVNKNNK